MCYTKPPKIVRLGGRKPGNGRQKALPSKALPINKIGALPKPKFLTGGACGHCKFSSGQVYSTDQAEIPNGSWQGGFMKRFLIAFIVLLLGLTFWRPLFAHHSSSSYDMEHPVNMKGVISNVEWTNPHVFIFLNVKDEMGNTEEWRVEGNSPNMLTRVGWKKEMIKPGDELLVNGAPAKNGSKIMRLISITLANGQKYDGQGFK
jgi:uncharacterized protein DUF6152